MKFIAAVTSLTVLAIGGAASAGVQVIDGSFTSGPSPTTFQSDYTFADQSLPGYSEYPAAQFEITTNTAAVRSDGAWGAFGGPVAGESFMVINGSGTAGADFWKETLTLPAGAYVLTAAIANLYPVSPPTILLTGVTSSSSYLANGAPGAWSTETFRFTTTGGPVTLGLTDSNLQGSGNDFAVTNISLGVPEPATWAMMIVGLLGVGLVLRQRKVALAA
jgi:hypothetical protein